MRPRSITLRVFGVSGRHGYRGMGGAVTSFRKVIKCYSYTRSFDPLTVAPFLERAMNASRQVWPVWMPPQEPIWEVTLR